MLFNNVSEKVEDLIEILGTELFEEVVKVFGGGTIYIPTYNSMIRSRKNRDIAKKFNGVNAQQLAREYGVSVNHIIRIAKDKK
ncbi:Mor transcription activator family protein [Asaccharospora irregularis]|uniref:Mor transcription activator family protein n=1 Tax=Asaccharospora irregularis DSM 2635 TaxID=1121321 RepID=A0A1M5T7A2_9FIRM|nr:Mor transcription activator family protein [Asaccharospora irregularis]SHH46647.1 Mor transcription activator family protein [Asaccharospora irregularis DSM 2635]